MISVIRMINIMNINYLPASIFEQVIRFAPLISIDLIITDRDDNVLLGERLNRPAKGYKFVPGGRIRKNEKLNEALNRISKDEMGCKVLSPGLLGIYNHVYNDNYFNDEEFNTHYVVLAIHARMPNQDPEESESSKQHSEYCWLSVDDLLADSTVHQNVKSYFATEFSGFIQGNTSIKRSSSKNTGRRKHHGRS